MRCKIQGKSTASVGCAHEWDKPINDLSAGAPQVHPSEPVLVDMPVPAPGDGLDPGRVYLGVQAGGLAVTRYHSAADLLELAGGALPQ